MVQDFSEYLWIPIAAVIIGLFTAFGIGANDAANSFATSVGSKVLTLRQACLIAAVFEFLGAFLMGSHVTDTVRKKIIDGSLYDEEPQVLMYGMMCACLGSGIWLYLASWMKLPVSTTHSIVGSIVGFSLVAKGGDSVYWSKIGMVVASWVASPLLSGIISMTLFFILRSVALRNQNPVQRTLFIWPIMTFVVFFVNSLFIIYKGSPQLNLKETSIGVAIGVSIGIGLFFALIAQFIVVPLLKKNLKKIQEKKGQQYQKGSDINTDMNTDIEGCQIVNSVNQENDSEKKVPALTEKKSQDVKSVIKYDDNLPKSENLKLLRQSCDNLQKEIQEDKIMKHHENAEQFDDDAEHLCKSLQVLTACFSSFAHGANDVANSIGPLAAVFAIYQAGEVPKKSEVPLWILALGGIGIVIGLFVWGYKIIDRIGKELTKITPSRGFVMEISDAITVIIASRLGIPVSTTHCQVGAVTGVGILDGRKNVDWFVMAKVVLSWIVTLPIAGLTCAIFFSIGHYSPC